MMTRNMHDPSSVLRRVSRPMSFLAREHSTPTHNPKQRTGSKALRVQHLFPPTLTLADPKMKRPEKIMAIWRAQPRTLYGSLGLLPGMI